MSFVGDVVKGAFGVLSPLLFGKKPKVPDPVPQATRNEAAEEALKRDRVAKRRGAAANLLLGAAGAESSAGKKTSLGT